MTANVQLSSSRSWIADNRVILQTFAYKKKGKKKFLLLAHVKKKGKEKKKEEKKRERKGEDKFCCSIKSK